MNNTQFGQYPQNAQFGQNAPYSQNAQFGGYDQNQQGQQSPLGFGAAPQNDYNSTLNTGASKDSFFKALFDLSFTKYTTPSVVKVVYVLMMIFVGLYVVFGFFALIGLSFSPDGNPLMLILGLPFLAVAALAILALVRVSLEVSVAQIRTSQAVGSMDERDAKNELRSAADNSSTNDLFNTPRQ